MSQEIKIEVPHKPGETLFMIVFFLLSVVLVLYLGDQTKFSGKGKFFAQPRVWPAIGVIGMAGFSALHLIQTYNRRVGGNFTEAMIWLRGLEYVAWFMVYVTVVPWLGYLLATILFTVALALRVGYRRPRTLVAAAGTGLLIVLIFKTMLSVRIPGGAIYEYLPPVIRNFMILNF